MSVHVRVYGWAGDPVDGAREIQVLCEFAVPETASGMVFPFMPLPLVSVAQIEVRQDPRPPLHAVEEELRALRRKLRRLGKGRSA